MSPDFHWHVGEEAEQETVVKTTLTRRSRRSWIAILIIVILGAGLGVVYRSIPEPASRPAPTPSPTPRPTPTRPAVPDGLYDTIDREAQALASGAVETVMALHTPQEKQVAEWRRLNFRAWGRPSDGRPLYTIIDFDLHISTRAWADVRQFRNGRSFRETRFYRWEDDRWLRSDPDPFFWSERTESLNTPRFHVIYAVEDRELMPPVIDHLEGVYDSLCSDLECGAESPTYTLSFNSGVNGRWPISASGRDIRFVSPRVMGVYEDATPLGEEGLSLIWMLAWSSVYHAAYGHIPALIDARNSNVLLWAISYWATMRAVGQSDTRWPPEVKAEVIKHPLPLETLWTSPAESNSPAVYSLAYATIHFVEQEYGVQSLARLLRALGTARSFSDMIESGLGVPFAEFDQKWQTWLAASISP